MELEKQVNNRVMEIRQEILDSGQKLRGKQTKVLRQIKNEFELNEFELSMDNNTWLVKLNEKGTSAKRLADLEEEYELKAKRKAFIERVNNGSVEKSIENWIEKKYDGKYEVEHSRSMVKSESFYIVHEGEKIVKLSLHNTIFQEMEHNTPFIDLNGLTSVNQVKEEIEKRLN